MTSKPCAACGAETSAGSLVMSSCGEICPNCQLAEDSESAQGIPPLAIAALAAGVIPFGVSLSSSSTTTVNGQVTSSSYFDPVAVACGVLALVLGAVAIKSSSNTKARAAAAVALLLGAVQLLRGFGVV